jgi:hypothetical protein
MVVGRGAHMSEYQLFMEEKQKIDAFISQGYLISNVREDLSGGFFEFTPPHNNSEKVTLLIHTANARKYSFTLLIKQQCN